MKTILNTLAMVLMALWVNGAQTVSTYSPTNISYTTATLNGYVDPDGIKIWGVEFEFATNSSFTNSTVTTPDEGTNFNVAQTISLAVTGLSPNTTYFYRVKGGSSGLIGSTKNFTTLNSTVPSVSLGNDFSNITSESANNSNNEVTGDGGLSVDDKGLVVATHSNPSVSDTKISVASGMGNYSGTLTNLNQLTKYYVKAYGHNSKGYGYSSIEKSLITLATTNASINSLVSNSSGCLTIDYNLGSGDGCIIYMRDNNQIIDEPTYGTTYSGDAIFGNGSDIGNGTYVVYCGSGAKGAVNVSGLDDTHDYYIKISSVGGSGTSTAYDVSNSQQNSSDNSNLPINLISFKAMQINGAVKLNWVTASEINNDFFVIEKSNDAQEFYQINKVYGAGNSNQLINYECTDNEPIENICYYRLKQVDFDGTFTYSEIISLQPNSLPLDIKNIIISNNQLQFSIMGNRNNSHLIIFDNVGREVYNEDINTDGNKKIRLSTNRFDHGIYYISYFNNAEKVVKKVVL